MDYLVEATVHLNHFQDASEVRGVLRSHGFAIVELGRGQVRVKGSFSKLVDVQACLELLRQSQLRTTPPSSPLRAVSPGAVPKYYDNNNWSRPRYRDEYPHHPPPSPSSSPHSSPVSQDYGAAVSPAPSRPGTESFVVDADVFSYAKHLRNTDIDTILKSHNIEMHSQECNDSTVITLQGKNSKTAANKLKDLLESLTKSLRTQEVPLRDMDHEGTALFEKIRRDKHVHGLVLVCEKSDRLHLIGPSGQSYELKQKLLGRKSGPPGRPGRTFSKESGRRSSSLPPTNRNNTGRENSGRARGYSPQRAPDAAAAPRPQVQSGASRRRSSSESDENKAAQRAAGAAPERAKKHNTPLSPKFLSPLLNVKNNDIKEKISKFWKK